MKCLHPTITMESKYVFIYVIIILLVTTLYEEQTAAVVNRKCLFLILQCDPLKIKSYEHASP